MADVKKINGYNIKDSVARENIARNSHNTLTNIERLENKYSSNYHRIFFPETMDPFFDKLIVYESYDKKKYTYYIDEESLKNSGGNQYYIDINSTSDTEDGSIEHPWKKFTTMFANTSNGDTVYVKRGIYTMSEFPASSVDKKNINIIAEEGTIVREGTDLTWSQDETYTNVYKASRTRVGIVIDMRKKDEGIFPRLTQKDTLAEVATNVNTFYFDDINNIVYVNLGVEVTNDNIAVNLNSNYCPFYVKPLSQNLKMYVENITFLAGTGTSLFKVDATTSYTAELNCKNCRFLFGGASGNYGAMSVGGAKTVFINCEASFNTYGDGFAYHQEGGKNPRAIEINCTGSYNGLESTSGTLEYANNGSTIHQQCQIIRINGNYHHNKGCNVADTGGSAISLNYNCKAWDSEVNISGHNRNADFGALDSSAKMYLYSCFAQGKSEMNLYSGGSNNVINVYNCLYNTTGGNGTINVIE